MPPAWVGRRSGASGLRLPLTLGRCDRCHALRLVRGASSSGSLCGSCLAAEAAVAQASATEPLVRSALYRRGPNSTVEAIGAPGGRGGAPAPRERRLRVALLAPPWLPVPPAGYGGTEQVVALLADALTRLGHDVTLLAAPGSRSAARVVTLLDGTHGRQIGASVVEADHVARAFAHIEEAGLRGRPFDVVHDHSGWVALAMADRLAVPVLHTVHGSFDERAARFYLAHARKAAISCISHAQAAMCPDGVRVDAVVPNPVDVDAWPSDVQKGDYLLWVGRFAAEKGPHRAIRVARRARMPLALAGPVQPGQERFFAEAIEPHVDGERVRYVGEVGGRRKQELFAAARALLMPIRWPEPFGMVMVEAMAAGTPVVAFAEGSAPEVIEAGRSGLLVGDEEEMADAVPEAVRLDRAECRASARERFSPAQVARRYEAAYRTIATPAAPARHETDRDSGLVAV